MATNLQFVPGRNAGSENPILNGYRFILNRKKDDSVYWKCALFRTGCSARITTVDKQLMSPVPAQPGSGLLLRTPSSLTRCGTNMTPP